MRRRRAETDDLDALNLLLDTVCNMFGIFIFSSLIVALMAMSRATAGAGAPPEKGRPREVSERILATEESIRSLNEQIERVANGRQARVEARAKDATGKLRAAERELRIRQETLDEYREKIAKDADLLRTLREEVPRLDRQIAQLEEQLRRARQLKEVDVRTPLRRELKDRTPVQVVLHDGRAYILNNWATAPEGAHPCDIWCEWNDRAVVAAASECDPTRFSCVRGGAIEIHRRAQLRDGGGIPAESADDLAKDPEWRAFMAAMARHPDRYVLSLRCTRSGFRAFGPVRGEIVSHGLPYNVEPTVLDPFYRDDIVEGTPLGQ